MAKFKNPWSANNSEWYNEGANQWYEQPKSTEQIDDKKVDPSLTAGAPPPDFIEYAIAGGGQFYLPKGSIVSKFSQKEYDNAVTNFGKRRIESSGYEPGQVKNFTIGNKKFVGDISFVGKFQGYFDDNGNAFRTPEFFIEEGEDNIFLEKERNIDGELKKAPELNSSTYTSQIGKNSKVRMIQVFKTPDIHDVDGGTVVNGIRYPYFNTTDTNENVLDSGMGTGTFKDMYHYRMYDFPFAVKLNKYVYFTTMLVIQNYLDSGKDVLIGHFRWGYEDFGKITIDAAKDKIVFKRGIPQDTKTVLFNEYPDYEILGY